MADPRQYAGGEPFRDFYERLFGSKLGLLYGGGFLQPFTPDLSSAQPLKEFDLAGDFLYLDKSSTGTIKVKFDMAQAQGFELRPADKIDRVPFKRLLLEWDAQPGETAVLWTGYGANVIPAQNDIAAIGSILNPVDIDPDSLADSGWSSYVSSTVLGTGGTEQVFAAGANTAGGIILSVQMWTARDATSLISLLLKNGAPTTNVDGIPVCVMGHRLTGSGTYSGELIPRPRQFNSGTGLYFYNLNVETAGIRQVIYKLF